MCCAQAFVQWLPVLSTLVVSLDLALQLAVAVGRPVTQQGYVLSVTIACKRQLISAVSNRQHDANSHAMGTDTCQSTVCVKQAACRFCRLAWHVI